MLAASAAAALLLLRPQEAASAVRAGLALCAGTVVPSLFPFFAAISLLLQLGAAEALGRLCAPIMRPLFRMRGVCALPLLAGLLGGYPSGAKTAASLYAQGRITRQEAELLLGFCDNCGPAFLLGCVGAGVLGDPATGLWLFSPPSSPACSYAASPGTGAPSFWGAPFPPRLSPFPRPLPPPSPARWPPP